MAAAEVVVARFIAKFAFGFISDKVRDYATEKLQDGDLTDEKFKGYIIRELTEINSKLDAISRRELSASISALEQGVRRLLDICGTAGANSTETRPDQVSVTVDDAVSIAIAIGTLKIKSHDVFEKARECFKQAGIEGRRAFHNTALSIEERIHANKVRMASTILEHLDHPEVAASDCLLFLEELHAMPAVQEMFSVHVKGGIKSLFKKDSRREAIKEVMMMNLNLSDFITKFTERRMAVLHWPMVYCDKLVVHPIHCNEDCFNEMKKMGITPPWDLDSLREMLERIAKLRGANASNNRIKSTLCCVTYPDNNQRGILKLQMPGVNDLRSLYLSPVDLHSSAHCVAVEEYDDVYVLKVSLGYVFSHRFSAQVYYGDGVCVNDIRLKVPFLDHFAFFSQGGGSGASFYLGKDEEQLGGLIFCFVGESNMFANLHGDDGDVLLSYDVYTGSQCILASKHETVLIPNEHFFRISQHPKITEIAFVYTLGKKLKGIVGLYPNCPDSPSSSPLWDRYLPIIHVTADGETLRCLHSGENMKVLYSRGF